MFICDDCLNKNFTNGSSIMQSFGMCEFCKKVKPCNDIPSKYLKSKKQANNNKEDVPMNSEVNAKYNELTQKLVGKMDEIKAICVTMAEISLERAKTRIEGGRPSDLDMLREATYAMLFKEMKDNVGQVYVSLIITDEDLNKQLKEADTTARQMLEDISHRMIGGMLEDLMDGLGGHTCTKCGKCGKKFDASGKEIRG